MHFVLIRICSEGCYYSWTVTGVGWGMAMSVSISLGVVRILGLVDLTHGFPYS